MRLLTVPIVVCGVLIAAGSDEPSESAMRAAFETRLAAQVRSVLEFVAETGGEDALARIRAAQLLVDTSSYPDLATRLEPATAPTATFRHTARELLALSAWRANDMTSARKWLDMIANDGETPPGMRSRAEALQALLPPVAKS